MIHSAKFKALLDTNVIFPVFVRDLLFWFAFYDLILQNGVMIFLRNGKMWWCARGVAEEEANNRIKKGRLSIPWCLVSKLS